MILWIIAYVAFTALHWGAFTCINKETLFLNAVMALIWPFADFAILGYAIVQKVKS